MAKCYLTVDELIIEYMIYRVRENYEPKFTVTSFMKFLDLLKTKMEIEDIPNTGVELFKRFFERMDEKNKYSSYIGFIDYTRKDPLRDKEEWPKITMDFSNEENDYVIKAGNHLCIHEGSHSMHYDKKPVENIKVVMDEVLSKEQKRTIDENTPVSEDKLQIGKYIAAKMIKEIWLSDIDREIERKRWPHQCTDINKYLFEMDLAPIIGVTSIKSNLIELYKILAKRIAILYTQDKDLKIESGDNTVLCNQNYRLLIQGNERLIGYAYGDCRRSLEIDFSNFNMKESYEYGTSYYDEDADVAFDNTKLGNKKILDIVLALDNEGKKSD